ncbi:MAG: hypothetical protein ABSF80_13740 [Chitinispirillaceae bacterium]|jgi:photosystem II stability/assembly factor-like uncharacterized protein
MKAIIANIIAGMGILVLFPLEAGAQWVQTNWTGNSTVLSLAVSDTTLFAGTYSGIYFSSDSGATWTHPGSVTDRILSLAVMGSQVFAGTDNGIYLSANNGTSWVAIDSGLPANVLVHSLVVSGTNIFAGTHSHGIYLSSDSGISWVTVDSGLPAATSVYSLAENGSQVFAGTYAGGIFLSTNNGTTWTAANSGLPASTFSNYVFSLAVCGADIFAGIGNGVFSSADSGASWNATGTSNQIYSDVYCLTASGTKLFAGTYSDGIFLSTNNGLSWIAINSGLPLNIQVMCLAVSGGYIYTGSGNYGVWRFPLSDISVKRGQNPLSEQFAFKLLSSNRSNPSVTIAFSLPRAEQVMVKIYNISGNLMTALLDKPFGIGPHSVPWDTRNLPAGCYMVRMQAGANSQVKAVPLFR